MLDIAGAVRLSSGAAPACALEIFSVPLGGEHFLRRPLNQVRAAGFDIDQVQRFKLGLVERLVAGKAAAT
jgi:hypothetical protein